MADNNGQGDSVWTRSIAEFGSALADPHPMPAGVAAATVTASIGFALFLKVLAIAAKKQPIPGLAGAARRHLLDLEKVVDADAAAYERYVAAPKLERGVHSALAIRIPLEAARSSAAGVELCAQAHRQVVGPLHADLMVAAAILHASAVAMLACVQSNLSHMPLDENLRIGFLAQARHVAGEADTARARMNAGLD
jgi:formiminotetrahydrofolate cyclodeaminase